MRVEEHKQQVYLEFLSIVCRMQKRDKIMMKVVETTARQNIVWRESIVHALHSALSIAVKDSERVDGVAITLVVAAIVANKTYAELVEKRLRGGFRRLVESASRERRTEVLAILAELVKCQLLSHEFLNVVQNKATEHPPAKPSVSFEEIKRAPFLLRYGMHLEVPHTWTGVPVQMFFFGETGADAYRESYRKYVLGYSPSVYINEENRLLKARNVINVSIDNIKEENEHLVMSFYGISQQCLMCGLRFPRENMHLFGPHLENHYRRNKRLIDKNKKRVGREWYVAESAWLSESVSEKSAFAAITSVQIDENPAQVPVRDRGADLVCCRCLERFELVWLETQAEWAYKDAVVVEDLASGEDTVCHIRCYN